MKTKDLFTTTSKKINESIEKTFGKRLNLETFDLSQLEDARNKLRTQLSQIRSTSGFNENLENETYHRAQWMLDAINAEISEREEFILDSEEMEEKFDPLKHVKNPTPGEKKAAKDVKRGSYADRAALLKSAEADGRLKKESAPPTAKGERMVKHIKKGYADDGKLTDKEKGIAYATAWKQHNKDKNEDMNTTEAYINTAKDAIDILADIRKQSKMAELGQGDPVRPNQLVNDLWDVMQWIENNMKESIETESVENSGEEMTNLKEGEVQQASAIVTAKTMVDRVGRWIEELSGMENETLLQLGDSIRDEMGQDQAKAFIEQVAPAIQQALETLKGTRDTLSNGVRSLASGETPSDMIGAEPAAGETDVSPAEPDALNAPEAEPAADEFAAAEPAAGGAEAAGREQRESIQFENKLLKVLAG